MKTRLDLSELLRELLGSNNVYYQPPESLKMSYPAIRYSKSDIDIRHANDGKYIKKPRWEIIVISKLPDNEVIERLLDLEYCSFDRHYVADNLHHDVLTLFY